MGLGVKKEPNIFFKWLPLGAYKKIENKIFFTFLLFQIFWSF